MTVDRFEDSKARQPARGCGASLRITETSPKSPTASSRAGAEAGPWLDVATGTGPLALRAARAGATVIGVDLAPALIATARQLAAAAGLRIAFEVGDCERLTLTAASFDVWPRHRHDLRAGSPRRRGRARSSLRPGGRLASPPGSRAAVRPG